MRGMLRTPKKTPRAIIIDGVPKKESDMEIQSSPSEQFVGSKGTRFVK